MSYYVLKSRSLVSIHSLLTFKVILAVGVVVLDYASQAAINPCEALMSDMMAGQVGTLRGQSYQNDYLSPLSDRDVGGDRFQLLQRDAQRWLVHWLPPHRFGQVDL